MFLQDKQNKQSNKHIYSSPNQRLNNFHQQQVRQEKHKKFFNLRQINTSQIINWKQPLPNFIQSLNHNHNLYSLLLTLFQITQDPFWRNKIHHICTLIQKLHNSCVETNGNYLREMTQIPDYQSRLCRIFYLNDNTLQEHFKLLIMLYLYYNKNLCILDQNAVAIGLVNAGRCRTDNRLAEYLWLVSQIQTRIEAISKVLKASAEFVQKKKQTNMEQALKVLLPTLTILSNYIYFEQNPFVLDQLLENQYFQTLLLSGLREKSMIQVSRQALLLVNNFLSKSKELAEKLMGSAEVMQVASSIICEQQPIFEQLVKLRQNQAQNFM